MSTGTRDEPRPAKWWLPDQHDEGVPGLYWIDENGAAHATLHGQMKAAIRPWRSAPVPLLHGNVMGMMVTLCDSRPIAGTMPMVGDVMRTELAAGVALEGFGLSEEELQYDRAVFSIRGLAEWADWTTWHDLDEADFAKPPRVEHLGEQRRKIQCPGASLSLVDDGTWSEKYGTWTFTSGCRFELDLDEPLTLDDLDYRWLRPLQLLVTTATGATAPIVHLSVANTGWQFDESESAQRRPYRRARVRFRSGAAQSTSRLSSLICRHLLSDFNDGQLAGFFESADHHRYALERYSDASAEMAGSRETLFLNAVQAVEALDTGLHEDTPAPWQEAAVAVINAATAEAGINSQRRRAARRGAEQAHVPSLSTRLRRADAELGGSVTELAERGWAQDVELLRNAVTHGRTGSVLRKSSSALVVGTEIAMLLFDLRWLMVMGFDAEDANRIIKRRTNQWSDVALIRDHADRLHEGAEALRALRST